MTQPANTSRNPHDPLLTRLVHDHARLLYRVAYTVLRNPADAEDAVQDALLKLVCSQNLPEITHERAFLARAVYRTALNRVAARPTGVHLADELTTASLTDVRPGPETAAAEADLQQLLARWIDELPEELRQTVLITAIEGLNSREAGEVLGLPEATVRTRNLRARQILRERAQQMETRTETRRGRRVEVAATAHGDKP